MNKKIILIGPCGGGSMPNNGASAKNYHLIEFLKNKGFILQVIDTEHWRKNPFILIKLLFSIILNPNALFIVAADSMSAYKVITIIYYLPITRSVIYWVIGGSVANWIKDRKIRVKPYKKLKWIIVEGKKMKETLEGCGFDTNVIYVPNFKNITYQPRLQNTHKGTMRFIFLSRIIPEKGCNTILDAVEILNSENLDFSVDFYGPVEQSYKYEFEYRIKNIPNASYNGFIDLRNQKNYDTLAEYDAMLFPTYWHGEGFPGIIIDAFIAGLPVIASDWNLNADIIENGKTGIILKGNNVDALVDEMKAFIKERDKVKIMSCYCYKTAMIYDIKNVLSEELIKKMVL